MTGEPTTAPSKAGRPADGFGHRFWRSRGCFYRLAIGAAGLMLALAACIVVAWLLVAVRAERRARRSPGGPDSAIQLGQVAPDFELLTDDGRPLALSDLRGRPVAINFWATWCLPCRLEVPTMTKAARDYEDEGLVILSVNLGEDPELVLDFLAERDIAYEVLLDPDAMTARPYSVVGMPTTLWIDGDGVIRAVDLGMLTDGIVASRMEALTAE